MSTVIRLIGMLSGLPRIAFICWLACLLLALLGWEAWIIARVGMRGIRNFPIRRGAALAVSEN
jgi:hypothetical protein